MEKGGKRWKKVEKKVEKGGKRWKKVDKYAITGFMCFVGWQGSERVYSFSWIEDLFSIPISSLDRQDQLFPGIIYVTL